MIIVKLMGGLGNQLQQYALYKKIESLGKKVYMDISWFEKKNQETKAAPRRIELYDFDGIDFGIASRFKMTQLKIQNHISKKSHKIIEDKMYYPELLEWNNAYLEGYWACEKYYADILPNLRQEIIFDINKATNIDMLLAVKQQIKACKSCAVHIRRGDYLDEINRAMFGNIATEQYYDNAFGLARKKHPEVVFFVFSDDIEYVKEKYADDASVVIVDVNKGADSKYDIYLMSICEMHICANSTFSFWGARLSENHELNIRPTIQKNSQLFDYNEMIDLWKGWTFIDPKGNIY